MGGVEKLRCLEDHLDDMGVAVGLGRPGRVEIEQEDVHGGRSPQTLDRTNLF
jgi:hypothetical protein